MYIKYILKSCFPYSVLLWKFISNFKKFKAQYNCYKGVATLKLGCNVNRERPLWLFYSDRIDSDSLNRPVIAISWVGLSSLHNIITSHDFTEDNMTIVQPRCLGNSDEKLGAIGVGSSIGHREESSADVLQLKVFIVKPFPINGTASSAWTNMKDE